AGLKPFLRQTRSGSGVPGNGTVRQSANAQSVLGICTSPPRTPVGVSEVAEISVALLVFSVSGVRPPPVAKRYMYWVLTLPGTLMNRTRTGPVTGLPSGF